MAQEISFDSQTRIFLETLFQSSSFAQAGTGGGGGGGTPMGRRPGQSSRAGSSPEEKFRRKQEEYQNKFQVYSQNQITVLKNLEKLSEKEQSSQVKLVAASEMHRTLLAQIQSDGLMGAKRLEELPSIFKKAFESNGGLAQSVAKMFEDPSKSFEESLETFHDATYRAGMAIEELKESGQVTNDILNDLGEVADDLGVTLNDLGVDVSSASTTIENLEKNIGKLGSAAIKAQDKAADRGRLGKGKLARGIQGYQQLGGMKGIAAAASKSNIAVAGILAAGQKAWEIFTQRMKDQSAIMEYAGGGAGVVQGIKELGMNAEETAKLLGQNKQVYYALEQSGLSYVDVIATNRDEMINLTGSVQNAIRFNAAAAKDFTRIGDASIGVVGVVEDQQKLYEDTGRIIGQTAEEFGKLRTEIVEDASIRQNISRLKDDERYAYIRGIQAQVNQAKAMNYTTEEAMAMAKTFSELAIKSAPERMQKGSKMAAMMGMLGMGAGGQEYLKLSMQLPMLSGPELEKANERLTQLTQQASNIYNQQVGSGMGANAAYTTFAGKHGLVDEFAKFTPRGKEQGKIDEANARAQEQRFQSETEFYAYALSYYERISVALDNLNSIMGSFAEYMMGKVAGFFKDTYKIGQQFFGGAGGAGASGVGGVGGSTKAAHLKQQYDSLILGLQRKQQGHQGGVANLVAGQSSAVGQILEARRSGAISETVKDKLIKERQDALQAAMEPSLKEMHNLTAEIKDLKEKSLKAQDAANKSGKETAKNTGKSAEELEKSNAEKDKDGKGYRLKLMRSPGGIPGA